MKAHTSTALGFVVHDTYVRQDEHGRYSFNDLHAAAIAAGHDYKNCQVEHFTRNDTTAGLIAQLRENGELKVEPLVSTVGRYGGTWGCIELVYSYAMWISPAFQLKVIRAYIALTVSGHRIPGEADETLRHNRIKLARQLLLDVERSRTPFVRKGLLGLLRETHAALGMPSPDEALLLPLADPNEQDNVTLSAFWDGYRVLAAHGEPLNHARDTRLIAINLAQFQTAAAKHRLVVPSRLALLRALVHSTAPKFHSQKTVKSQVLHATVHCWVFEEMQSGEDGEIAA